MESRYVVNEHRKLTSVRFRELKAEAHVVLVFTLGHVGNFVVTIFRVGTVDRHLRIIAAVNLDETHLGFIINSLLLDRLYPLFPLHRTVLGELANSGHTDDGNAMGRGTITTSWQPIASHRHLTVVAPRLAVVPDMARHRQSSMHSLGCQCFLVWISLAYQFRQ